MYVKFIGASICFLLSLFNVLGAVRQIPVKTTLGNSSRPTVAQMKPPGTKLHWLSGGVFFAASIGLIAWAIWEYNSNIDLGIDSNEASIAPVVPPMSEAEIQTEQKLDEGLIHNMEQSEFKNLVPFRRPTADGSVPITPEQFKNSLEDDIWSD